MICFTFQLKLAGGVDAGAKALPRAAARRKTRNDETLRRKTVKQSWKNIKPSDLSDKLWRVVANPFLEFLVSSFSNDFVKWQFFAVS